MSDLAQRQRTYTCGQLYLLLISVLLFLSFPLASAAYVMKGKEIMLRRGQGASKSPFSLFLGHWVAGKEERRCSPGVPLRAVSGSNVAAIGVP